MASKKKSETNMDGEEEEIPMVEIEEEEEAASDHKAESSRCFFFHAPRPVTHTPEFHSKKTVTPHSP